MIKKHGTGHDRDGKPTTIISPFRQPNNDGDTPLHNAMLIIIMVSKIIIMTDTDDQEDQEDQDDYDGNKDGDDHDCDPSSTQ